MEGKEVDVLATSELEDAIEYKDARIAELTTRNAELEELTKIDEGYLRDQLNRIAELTKALEPFADFERVRIAMGGTTAKTGVLHGVHSSAGSAELTAEHFATARNALREG